MHIMVRKIIMNTFLFMIQILFAKIHSKYNIKDIAIFVYDKYAHLALRMQILMK